MSDNQETELAGAIRKILLEVWDPIGVRPYLKDDYKAVCDEYDRYVPEVQELLENGTTISDLEVYLYAAEKQEVRSMKPSHRTPKAAILLAALIPG